MKQIIKYLSVLSLCFLFLLLLISCEKVVFPGDDGPAPINNRLYVESNPSGASIYFDDRNSGFLTPDTVKWLSDGTHKITLKHPFYIDTSVVVSLSGGSKNTLNIDHFLNPGHFGKLECVSYPPKANIYFDDKSINKITPVTLIGIIPGLHKIKFTYPMHRSDSVTMPIIGGKLNTCYIFLDDTTKRVIFNKRNSQLTSEYVSAVAVDSNNIKWIGTDDEGLFRFDGKNWRHYSQSNSNLRSNNITSLAVDKMNNVWIGFGDGLMMFNGTLFIDYSEHLTYKNVTSLKTDMNGKVWIGTFYGLTCNDNGAWKKYTSSDLGLDSYIYAITVDINNKVWISRNGGLSIYNGSMWSFIEIASMKLPSRIGRVINAITYDTGGKIWVSFLREMNNDGSAVLFDGGIAYYDGAWKVFSDPLISTQFTTHLYTDRNNNKWVSTKYGLGKINTFGIPFLYTKANYDFPLDIMGAASSDAGGSVYVGTRGGGLIKLRQY